MNMKTDLATAIAVSVVGVLLAYFITNLIVNSDNSQQFTHPSIDESITTELAEPDPEVFNYKSINPTVEVYVGDCQEYNSNGECADSVTNTTDAELETIIESGGDLNQEDR